VSSGALSSGLLRRENEHPMINKDANFQEDAAGIDEEECVAPQGDFRALSERRRAGNSDPDTTRLSCTLPPVLLECYPRLIAGGKHP